MQSSAQYTNSSPNPQNKQIKISITLFPKISILSLKFCYLIFLNAKSFHYLSLEQPQNSPNLYRHLIVFQCAMSAKRWLSRIIYTAFLLFLTTYPLPFLSFCSYILYLYRLCFFLSFPFVLKIRIFLLPPLHFIKWIIDTFII